MKWLHFHVSVCSLIFVEEQKMAHAYKEKCTGGYCKSLLRNLLRTPPILLTWLLAAALFVFICQQSHFLFAAVLPLCFHFQHRHFLFAVDGDGVAPQER